ncbi:hypothetical protein CWB99_21280 [Pseudoalteromonas rubra]|uniref:DUF4340 domain-containing protein n=1 Tax=Pseudoalteromonas rubra TaxID=43658 RepID=A0A5S3WH31_9GAMM|nr:hypothetical protein [Pseudoalteromonas rubra]TMP25244.1 hypothetical protein CWB99_21280 [Pseudoalteromonas rubra]TMP35627.1 hypothetical protein CWC00_03725 [Pseudoalteromonas rubra]
MRLSRKAWNNVVIFSMLIMIFFLNGIHQKMNPSNEETGSMPLFEQQSFVLALGFPGYKIERIGTSWRLSADAEATWQAPPATLDALVTRWQESELALTDSPGLPASAALSVAQFWLASSELPVSYQLYRQQQRYYLFARQSQRWFSLSKTQAQQLFAPIELK